MSPLFQTIFLTFCLGLVQAAGNSHICYKFDREPGRLKTDQQISARRAKVSERRPRQ